jgi:uncharacterized protein (DUF952 family)
VRLWFGRRRLWLGLAALRVYIKIMTTIYKISPKQSWREAEAAGVFTGAPVDMADGFIHFSAAHQVSETAAKHFQGQPDLVLAAIDAAKLGPALVWEPSRGGDLFPHLYGPLIMDAVLSVVDLPLDAEGAPLVPELIP